MCDICGEDAPDNLRVQLTLYVDHSYSYRGSFSTYSRTTLGYVNSSLCPGCYERRTNPGGYLTRKPNGFWDSLGLWWRRLWRKSRIDELSAIAYEDLKKRFPNEVPAVPGGMSIGTRHYAVERRFFHKGGDFVLPW